MADTDTAAVVLQDAELSPKNEIVKKGLPECVTDEVNSAILSFIQTYAALHGVTILHHQLENNRIDVAVNFFAGLVRLNFSYVTKQNTKCRSSALIKIPQMSPGYHLGLKLLLYQKEKFMYEEVFPRIEASWLKFKRLFPQIFACTNSGILIMENLQESGYYTIDYGSLLDTSGAVVALKTLARFHAISSIWLDSVQENLDALTITDFVGSSAEAAAHYSTRFAKFQKYVFPSLSQKTQDVLLNVFKKYRSVIEFSSMPNANGLNVILHGDAHCQNMLFQRDEQNEIVHCKLIDFQGCRRGSPVIDLFFFFMTSIDFEIFLQHTKYFFECYLEEFRSTISELSAVTTKACTAEAYKFEELEADLKKYSEYIVIVSCYLAEFRAIQLIKSNGPPQESALDSVLKSKSYIATVKGWVKYLGFE